MKKFTWFILSLGLMLYPFSMLLAQNNNVPNIAGQWHAIEFKELAQNQLAKVNNLPNALIGGIVDVNIEQHDRFFIMQIIFKLSQPVAKKPGTPGFVQSGVDKRLCVIASDNKKIYCTSNDEIAHSDGEIRNNQIEFIDMKHADSQIQDAYIAYIILSKSKK